MKIGRSVDDLRGEFGCSVATVGNFDGLHMGHMEILKRVTEKTKLLGCPSLLITFDPHPASVLYPARNLSLLTTPERKLELIAELGINAVLTLEFSLAFAKKGPKDFVDDILLPLGVRELYVGHDFAFGSGREGNVNSLAKIGTKHGFGVYEIAEVSIDGERVGSSRIRRLIEEGNVETAARLLGRPHSVSGEVVKGSGRGKKMGFPTGNITTPLETAPGAGVYATRTLCRGTLYNSATHVGKIPTFDIETPSIETHLMDANEDMLGERIEIKFIKKLRGTVKFDSAQTLTDQIKIDCEEARRTLEDIK